MTDTTQIADRDSLPTVPFDSAQEAWFWFVSAQAAKNDGARFVSGAGLYPRPCEPIDILKVLDRLHRNRRLVRDHLLVLRHYGRRHLAPDPTRVKENRAHHLWHEALERIEEVLITKGIVDRPDDMPTYETQSWHAQIAMFDGMAAE